MPDAEVVTGKAVKVFSLSEPFPLIGQFNEEAALNSRGGIKSKIIFSRGTEIGHQECVKNIGSISHEVKGVASPPLQMLVGAAVGDIAISLAFYQSGESP